uniref:Uncharacterized protein n=1 Tax=Glossina pallidipes TaxID=7398 RepID=A0A1B0A6L6_GLOPL
MESKISAVCSEVFSLIKKDLTDNKPKDESCQKRTEMTKEKKTKAGLPLNVGAKEYLKTYSVSLLLEAIRRSKRLRDSRTTSRKIDLTSSHENSKDTGDTENDTCAQFSALINISRVDNDHFLALAEDIDWLSSPLKCKIDNENCIAPIVLLFATS